MSNKGWIALHRVIQDSWMWKQEKEFNKTLAFIDLILLADHADGSFRSNAGTIIHAKRGTVYISQKELSSRWGWSRNKTSHFLKQLIASGEITMECPRGSNRDGTIKGSDKWNGYGTTITLVNYDFYQNQNNNKGSEKGSDFGSEKGSDNSTDNRTDSVQIMSTYNNVNNITNKKILYPGRSGYDDNYI